MRILIVNITRIGDQLQTSPTIMGLKERYPDSEITVLGDVHHMEVCYCIPGIDHVYEFDVDRIGQDLFAGGTRLVDAYRYVEQVIRDIRAVGFDLAFNFSSSRMSAVLMRLLRIPDCRGWTMDSEGNRLMRNPWTRLRVASVLTRRYAPYNLVDSYCRVAGVRPREQRLWYRSTQEGEARAMELLSGAGVAAGERVIAFQPGASNPIRQWPAAHFAATGRLLRERLGARILLVGGAQDVALCEQIAAEVGAGTVVAAGRTDLPTLAALLARSALLITGDTGPMHVATAVGTPVVAFYFGPAYVWETGPYSADSIAFQTRISCSPCNASADCLAPICRDELTPEMVFWAVRDRIAEDYTALARRAREWRAVDVYRIRFDGERMCEPIPLVPRVDEREALRFVYREMWRVALEDTEDGETCVARSRERWRSWGASGAAVSFAPQRRALENLRRLALRGEKLGETLAMEARRSAPSIERLQAINAEIEDVDRDIARQGHVEEAVATLSLTFMLGKENLSDTRALDVLSRETVELYRALGRWTTLTARLLNVVECPQVADTNTADVRDGIDVPAAMGQM